MWLAWCVALLLCAPSASSVAIHWGLPDAGAVAGKLFVYTIPPDAFKGFIQKYEISEAGSEEMPSWLSLDASKNQLFGVPGDAELGPYYISVTAFGENLNSTHASVASDIFRIQVRGDGYRPAKAVLEKQRALGEKSCEPDQPSVVVSILLDVQWEELRPLSRRQLLESAGKELGLGTDELRMRSARVVDGQSLLAGPGSSVAPRMGTGVHLYWRIGCGPHFSEEFRPELARVERLAASGQLAARTGYPVLSWQVTSEKFVSPKRRRELNYATPTPTYAPTPATRTPGMEIRPILTTKKTVSPTRTRTTAGPTITPTLTPTTIPLDISTRRPGDEKPQVRNRMNRLDCVRGVLCKKRIPADTFLDREDGSTYNLTLSLAVISDAVGESDGGFLFLAGPRRHHLLGLSVSGGTWTYRLGAMDTSGQMANTAFTAAVIEPELPAFNHMFQVHLAEDLAQFQRNISRQVSFVKHLAKFFRDRDASTISIRGFQEGSAVVLWSNNTLVSESCPDGDISRVLAQMRRSNGAVRRSFSDHMSPQFHVSEVSLQMEGVCLEEASSTGLAFPGTTQESETTESEGAGTSPVDDDGDFLISTVLPLVIIVFLLVLALCIACFLYKRNRKTKSSKDDGKNAFVSKGAPVIFPDEVEPGETEPSATTPMLVKEERSPLGVPETAAKSTSTPSKSGESHEMMERTPSTRQTTTEHENPLYKPPAPIQQSSTRSPRPKHTIPHHRDPPPYVPP